MLSTNMINVKYCRGANIVSMGRLAVKERKIYFEYHPDFIHSGLELSPLKLPLKPGVIPCEEPVFGGLFGVFNDSLPDGWGRLLLDRKLIKAGINPDALTPLDRLCYVGKGGMGALHYEPEMADKMEIEPQIDLDLISAECLQFLENVGDQYIEDLLILNGSSAGARPKILVTLLPNESGFQTSAQSPGIYHNDWIIKFPPFSIHLISVPSSMPII